MRWFTAVPSWMIPLWVNVKSWWLRLRGLDFVLVTWAAGCPQCRQSLAFVPVNKGLIHDGREVQHGVALPAEDHIVENEAHVECLRDLLDTEKQTVSKLQDEVADLKAQLELAKTMVQESNDQAEAAKAAAKSFGEDILELKRDARHVRYEQRRNNHRAADTLAALADGVEDIDLDDLINQLRHISEICDEQGNGADAKLCGEAASALSITRRALEDWDAI